MLGRTPIEEAMRIRPSDKMPEISCCHDQPDDEGIRLHTVDITSHYHSEDESLVSRLRSCVRDLVELRELLHPNCSWNPSTLAELKQLQQIVQTKGRAILESVSACQAQNERLSVLFSKYSHAAPTEAPIPADLLDEFRMLLH